MTSTDISIDDIDAFVLDFDGVLTDNKVYVNEDGKESVKCSRSDGLAFDALRKLQKPVYILSTEVNPVVSARAKKLKITVLQAVGDKLAALKSLVKEKGYILERIFYVGNDLNDYWVIQRCGHTACPNDSHPIIRNAVDIKLNKNGGEGVFRELLEDVVKIDFLKTLYS